MKKILSLIFVLTLICSIPALCFADDSTVIRYAREGTVRIDVPFENIDDPNESGLIMGSGFFVGHEGTAPQYVVTNHHVVEEYLSGQVTTNMLLGVVSRTFDAKMSLRVYFAQDDYANAKVIDYDEDQDIALLKIDSPTKKRHALPLRAPDENLVGNQIYAIGFPSMAINDAFTEYGVTDSLVTPGFIGKLYTLKEDGTKWMNLSNTEIGHGNSGGPVILPDGSVVGVVEGGRGDGDSMVSIAVDASAVIQMLNRNGVSFDVKTGAQTSSPAAVPAAPVQAVPTAAPTPAPTPAPTADPAQTSDDASEKEDSDKLIVILICSIGGALIAGIIAAVLIILKKQRKPTPAAVYNSQNQAQYPPVQPQRQGVQNNQNTNIRQPVMIPMIQSRVHGENTLRIRPGESVLVGRAPECGLVFPANTPGVSGKHCRIMWVDSARMFKVTDVGSSYGTYLSETQRMKPGVEYNVRPGGALFLGKKENRLILKVEYK